MDTMRYVATASKIPCINSHVFYHKHQMEVPFHVLAKSVLLSLRRFTICLLIDWIVVSLFRGRGVAYFRAM